MVEELQDSAVSNTEAQKRKRRTQIAVVAIFVIAAFLFIGWQMGWI